MIKIAESFGQYAIEKTEGKTRKRLGTMGAITGAGIGLYHRKLPVKLLDKLHGRSISPFVRQGALEASASKVLLHPEVYKALKKISPALMVASGLVKGNVVAKALYDFASD